ncbi:MAG: hypothetical protein ACREMI_05320, partial [Gemmatimonadales bacterium]
ELQWAQRAVLSDYQRIERPVLFVLGAQDRVVDPALAASFAGNLVPRAEVLWCPELAHDVFTAHRVVENVVRFVAGHRP